MGNTNHYGKAIEKARKDRGISRVWLAKKLEISYSTLADMEKGRIGCSIERASDIADIFNMTLDELLRPQVSETLIDSKTGTDDT